MKKIAIIGAPGSGKSTVALRVSEILDLPLIHLDCHYLGPGWKATAAEFKVIHDQFVAQPTWIIEGCFSKTIPNRIAAADAVVYLVVPRTTNLWRIIKRFLTRKQIGALLEYSPRLNWKFLTRTWNWQKRHEPMIMKLLQQYAGSKQTFVIKTPHDLERFLQACHKSS